MAEVPPKPNVPAADGQMRGYPCSAVSWWAVPAVCPTLHWPGGL